jgi:hypothetical protein
LYSNPPGTATRGSIGGITGGITGGISRDIAGAFVLLCTNAFFLAVLLVFFAALERAVLVTGLTAGFALLALLALAVIFVRFDRERFISITGYFSLL